MQNRASLEGRAELLDAISARLLEAPFRQEAWLSALSLLAEATGSSHGELIGWNGPYSAPINMITDFSDDKIALVAEWEQGGGADPAQNPIIRRGIHTSDLEIVSDDEIISRDDRKSHRIWREFYDKLDVPHMCFTPLWRDGQAQLIVAVLRSAREGVVDRDQRRIFAASATGWQAAAAMSRALKGEACRVLTGAFDNLSIAAIVVDGFGRPVAMSRAAEAAFEHGQYIRLHHGELRDVRGRPIDIQPAIRPPRRAHTVRIAGASGLPVTLRLSPLPEAAFDLGFGAAAMIVLETMDALRSTELPPDLVLLLTPAEQAIAAGLLAGERPAQIAQRRGISVETVRSHIKRIYAKCNVSGVLEFLAKARE